jgi:hypothetical protein
MRKYLVFLCCVLVFGASSATAGERTLSETIPLRGIERLNVEVGVGDVVLTAIDSGSASVELRLRPRRGGVFSSMKRGERDVAAAAFASEAVGQTLYLRVESPEDNPRFEELWTVTVPARLGLELELGVGEVTINGLAGGVELELGVVDAIVELADGDVVVELGVGDMTLRGPAEAYGEVTASNGVGNARLTIRGDSVDGEGLVGDTASWQGEGPHSIEINVGVGDTMIKLD